MISVRLSILSAIRVLARLKDGRVERAAMLFGLAKGSAGRDTGIKC